MQFTKYLSNKSGFVAHNFCSVGNIVHKHCTFVKYDRMIVIFVCIVTGVNKRREPVGNSGKALRMTRNSALQGQDSNCHRVQQSNPQKIFNVFESFQKPNFQTEWTWFLF